MVIVSSAVLGAAAGTGLALVVAMTIVVYRYYQLQRQGKEWEDLEAGRRKKNRLYGREIYFQVSGRHFNHQINILAQHRVKGIMIT